MWRGRLIAWFAAIACTCSGVRGVRGQGLDQATADLEIVGHPIGLSVSSPTGQEIVASVVEFDSFAAERQPDGVHITWVTRSETGTLAFQVAARDDTFASGWTLADLVAVVGPMKQYELVDRSGMARTGGALRYRIEELTIDGTIGNVTPWFAATGERQSDQSGRRSRESSRRR